ncbi:M56 family metallopeptidase, partial [Acinetobacter baumannii]
VWCAGMLASLLWFVLQHRWFMRSLGKLTAHNNIYLSEYSHTGPAMTGVWRPRIILPADFYQRYTGEEQMLVLRHEQIHLQRRDVC